MDNAVISPIDWADGTVATEAWLWISEASSWQL